MITGELKSKIDKLWEMFWTGGITNPLDVIEQVTYLMFIRDLDDIDNIRSQESLMLDTSHQSIFNNDNQQLRWSVFRDLPAATMYEIVQSRVFPFIKNLHGDKDSAYSKYMADAIDAVAQTAKLTRPIWENMSEVGVARFASDFNPLHPKGTIF